MVSGCKTKDIGVQSDFVLVLINKKHALAGLFSPHG